MASDNNDEKNFKHCVQSMIDTVTDVINRSQEQSDSDQLLDDLRKKFNTILTKSLSSLSSPCRNYLLHVLYQYDYSDEEKTLSSSFTADMLDSFLQDLQGRLQSLDVFKAAWNGEQAPIEEFIENYSQLKDEPGLYETTLLYSAARNHHFDLVQYLVEGAGCSVNTQNKEYNQKDPSIVTIRATIGSTALHAACYQGHLDIVTYLISHGGDYYIMNNAKESPVQNGKHKTNIRQFFTDFLIFGYSTNLSNFPKRSILQEIDAHTDPMVDCIWEYKPIAMNQWMSFTQEISDQLQQSLKKEPIETQIRLRTGRNRFCISLAKFLRFGPDSDSTENSAWIRCRGSSLLNFHCYAQWQIMFIKHPTGTINPSPSLDVLDMTSYDNIQFNSWYTADDYMNLIFETAMNYRRRYVNMYFSMIEETILLNFENFSFANEENTIEGFLRWIPKLISDGTDLSPIDNFQLDDDSKVMLLTKSCVKQAHDNEDLSSDEMHYYYELPYENVFETDDLEFVNQKSERENESNNSIRVIQGDLLAERTDAIVVCSLSKYLMDAVYKAGGKGLKSAFDKKVKENHKNAVISVPAEGSLRSKAIYFVPWKPSSDEKLLCQSIEQLVENVIEKAVSENLQSIAFPAIGCGNYGCPIDLIAKTFVSHCHQLLTKHPLSIVFVIQPEKTEIYDNFHREIASAKHRQTTVKEPPVTLRIGNGIIEVKKGDITQQQVDIIIGSSSSENLRQILLKAAGDQARTVYNKEETADPNASIIITPPGHLQCKKIFFFNWEPNKNKDILRKSIVDLISNVVKNVHLQKCTSIAFPALGCGEHACSVDIVVKTMVKEMKQQIEKNNLPWTVKFIIHPSQQNVYDEFCKQVLSSDNPSNDYRLPSTWERSDDDDQFRFIVPEDTDEYRQVITKFDQQMTGNYEEILKLERIQNERWYMQYVAHRKEFKKRLGIDTEKRLYHGCPDGPASSIIKDGFNRSFAGINGTLFGSGVYFSSRAYYSHGYANPNEDNEQCMFVCRVLAGKTTKGDPSMKVRPTGFDSTTDGIHMTVTYHDAQAYAEYLITYR